ncbi:cation acetate symporter [candidate division KSB1 bacterium]|nr:cation acetate symporter [candidate division KSB1 bacterium]
MEILSVVLFVFIVLLVLVLSWFFARRSKSASGYFAAGGNIHWSVNGIAFAGDYLSAASFLGICGMIATVGYDGFLYSIGYLAGWIVALFVIAEPMKRMGKYTFADALDSKYNSKSIQLTAAISTLIVSICYLIPQMVGAGSLVTPLLGLPHAAGVVIVGSIVIFIVATAGMTSTTYVQFLKGGLLVIFSLVLVFSVMSRGISTKPDQGGKVPFQKSVELTAMESDGVMQVDGFKVLDEKDIAGVVLVKMVPVDSNQNLTGPVAWWKKMKSPDGIQLCETQFFNINANGEKWINGAPASEENQLLQVGTITKIRGKAGDVETGPVGPFKFLAIIGDKNSEIKRWKSVSFEDGDEQATVYYPVLTSGNTIMRPGLKFKVGGTGIERMEFISLMLALFFGTAALPHILIRYYTVPSAACARKSTIVAIAAIGFFYILTMYMGLGAMVNKVVNLADNNMSAPLLAKSFGTFLFSMISAIAFATVLGTVSGLIVASSGAIAHDLVDRFSGVEMTDKQKVRLGRIAAFAVGIVAIILGIVFKGMNVSFLVGWAFAVAASANLPAILMLLFWKKTTAKGIAASIVVGIIAAIGIILLSPEMWVRYGLPAADAPLKFGQPGIFSIPLSFITLVVVSLMTQKKTKSA